MRALGYNQQASTSEDLNVFSSPPPSPPPPHPDDTRKPLDMFIHPGIYAAGRNTLTVQGQFVWDRGLISSLEQGRLPLPSA